MVTNETQEQLEARGWDFTEEFIPDEPTVNNQDKTVDIEENGTIEVTPDEGFTGLGKIIVNTNVEGGGENTYEYIELTRPEDWQGDDFLGEVVTPLMILCALLGKIDFNGIRTVMPTYMIGVQSLVPLAIAYDPNMLVQGPEGFVKVSEFLQMLGLPDLPHLTKEQFYDINS